MSSIRQLAANRANSTHSTGPVTAQGKAAASRNSTTHGLCSAKLVIHCWESQQDFDGLRNAYLTRHQPLDRCELDQVDQMVACIWRRQRILSIETTLLNLELSRSEEDITARFDTTADSLLRIALAFQEKQGDRTFDTIQRYASNLDRSFSRARNELQILQRSRFNQMPPPEPPPLPSSEEDDEVVESPSETESEKEAPSNPKIRRITERSHSVNPSEPAVNSKPQSTLSGDPDEPSPTSRDDQQAAR